MLSSCHSPRRILRGIACSSLQCFARGIQSTNWQPKIRSKLPERPVISGYQTSHTPRRTFSICAAMAEKISMVIDCDVGVDDASAIMMALRRPNVDVKAITCVIGNVDLDKVSINVLRVLQKCDRLDIPVFNGASSFIVSSPRYDTYAHGKDGLGDIPNPETPPSRELIKSEHAVNALIRMANENPRQLTLVAIGPLTNVALAMRMDPNFTSKLKEMIIMGGNIQARGTGYWTSEFNFGCDPEAAHIVLEGSRCPTIIVPIETCIEHSISYEWFEKLTSSDNSRAKFLYAINAASVNLSKGNNRSAYMMADPCAMVVAACRESVLGSTHSVCKVELGGSLTRGQMVTHKLNTVWIPHLEGVELQVVTQIDMKLFYQFLDDAVA